MVSPIFECSRRAFKSIPFPFIFRKKGEANIRIREAVSFEKAAHSDGNGTFFQLNQENSKSIFLVRRDWATFEISDRLIFVMYKLVADKVKPALCIQQLHN